MSFGNRFGSALANAMGFLGNYYGTRDLLKTKAETEADAQAKVQQNKIMQDMLEYSLWTNPNDPARQLLAAKMNGNVPLMKGVTPQQFMRLKVPSIGGGGGLFGGGGGGGGGGGSGIPEI